MQETWWKARHSAGIAEATQISVPLLLPYLYSVFMEVRFWGSPMRLPTASDLRSTLSIYTTQTIGERLSRQWFSDFRVHHKYVGGCLKTQIAGLQNLMQVGLALRLKNVNV